MERFMYNVKRGKLHNLGSDTLKTLLLRIVRDERIDVLNLMSRGDVYQLSFEEICETCKPISRGKARVSKSASRSVSQAKLGNLFDDFKANILSNLTKQVEMLRIQNEQKQDVFVVHVESHDSKHCPSFPRLKKVHQEDNGPSQLPMHQYYVAPREPWHPIHVDMMQEPNPQFQGYAYPPQSKEQTLSLATLAISTPREILVTRLERILREPSTLFSVFYSISSIPKSMLSLPFTSTKTTTPYTSI